MSFQIFVLKVLMAHVTGYREIHGIQNTIMESVPLMIHLLAMVTIIIVLAMVYVPIAA
jgi:hypothetical protein